jgi:hypothetical protein
MPERRLVLALLLLAGLVFQPQPVAWATETGARCTGTITSLPTVINTPGTWCLARDLATTITRGSAITIAANDVALDCNGHRIAPRVLNPGTEAVGISASNRNDISVRNCKVDGFLFGIDIVGGGGHVIEDNRLFGTVAIAIYLDATASIVRENEIFQTGGTAASSIYWLATGIAAYGDVDISENTISGISVPHAVSSGQALAIGIQFFGNGSIYRNRVRNLVSSTGDEMGLFVSNSANGRLNIHDNDLIGPTGSGDGILCFTSVALAVNNIVNGFSRPVDPYCVSSNNTTNP